jgi:hypothetical protein
VHPLLSLSLKLAFTMSYCTRKVLVTGLTNGDGEMIDLGTGSKSITSPELSKGMVATILALSVASTGAIGASTFTMSYCTRKVLVTGLTNGDGEMIDLGTGSKSITSPELSKGVVATILALSVASTGAIGDSAFRILVAFASAVSAPMYSLDAAGYGAGSVALPPYTSSGSRFGSITGESRFGT